MIDLPCCPWSQFVTSCALPSLPLFSRPAGHFHVHALILLTYSGCIFRAKRFAFTRIIYRRIAPWSLWELCKQMISGACSAPRTMMRAIQRSMSWKNIDHSFAPKMYTTRTRPVSFMSGHEVKYYDQMVPRNLFLGTAQDSLIEILIKTPQNISEKYFFYIKKKSRISL